MDYYENKITNCTACVGCCYQTFPVTYVGSFANGRLIIGQNPGKIKENDSARKSLFEIAAKKMTDDHYLEAEKAAFAHIVYEQDFLTSPAYKIMGKVFGENWTEEWCFTNAVRCRTPNNSQPSDQMVENCSDFTRTMLAGKKVVVMMGKIATRQVSSIVGRDFEVLKPTVNKKAKVIYLSIPHFAMWPYMKGEETAEMRSLIYEITREGVLA